MSLTRATVDEQTRRLDDHDTKLHDQQSASFFGSKNSLEKLDKFKEKQDQLSLRVLEAPKNFALDPPGASVNEGTSKYIPPNERARANPKVGGQKTLQFTSGAGTSKNMPPHGSAAPFKGANNLLRQGAGTLAELVLTNSSPAPKSNGQATSFSAWPNHEEGAEPTPMTAADWRQLISIIVME